MPRLPCPSFSTLISTRPTLSPLWSSHLVTPQLLWPENCRSPTSSADVTCMCHQHSIHDNGRLPVKWLVKMHICGKQEPAHHSVNQPFGRNRALVRVGRQASMRRIPGHTLATQTRKNSLDEKEMPPSCDVVVSTQLEDTRSQECAENLGHVIRDIKPCKSNWHYRRLSSAFQEMKNTYVLYWCRNRKGKGRCPE